MNRTFILIATGFTIWTTFLCFQLVTATQNETDSETVNCTSRINENVLYSYSQAIVGEDGKPKVSQLIISKGKDGEYHYLNGSSNGTVETGKWTGPLPSVPKLTNVLANKMNKLVNNSSSNLAERLSALSESIATSFKEYVNKALIF